MKVIFLDIDGVIVSYRSVRLAMLIPFREKAFLDPRALRGLRQLVKETGAKIVITSSWRGCGEPYEWFKRKLARNGTPVFGETEWLPYPDNDRSDEIFQWIQTHDVERFVVLDDTDDFFHRISVRRRWIPVDTMTGLTGEYLEPARKMLE